MQQRATPKAMRQRMYTVKRPFGVLQFRIFGDPRFLQRGTGGAQTKMSLATMAYKPEAHDDHKTLLTQQLEIRSEVSTARQRMLWEKLSIQGSWLRLVDDRPRREEESQLELSAGSRHQERRPTGWLTALVDAAQVLKLMA
jgi:hypothetical protein